MFASRCSLLGIVFLMALGLAYVSMSMQAGVPRQKGVPVIGVPLNVSEVVVIRSTATPFQFISLLGQYGDLWRRDSYPVYDLRAPFLVVHVRVSRPEEVPLYHRLEFRNIRPMVQHEVFGQVPYRMAQADP